MSRPLDLLVERLNEKELLLEGLLTLLEQERGRIVELDATAVAAGSETKLRLMDLLEQSGRSCRDALEEAARELGRPGAGTLSEILGAVGQPHRGRLEKTRQRLVGLIDAVHRQNGFNRDLLYGSLSTINRSLDFFRSSFGGVVTYSGEGRMLSGFSAGRLVRGEI